MQHSKFTSMSIPNVLYELMGFAIVLEHGSPIHRQMALDHIVTGLLEFATNEQGSKSVTKALKEGGKDTLDRIVRRMAESSQGYGLI